MNIKRFIDRPILSCVISVVIVFLGIIGLNMLPIEQFPEIAPPTISVSASYTGASAETVQKSVIIPLEEAINGVENMLYMTSTATSTGSASISVYFRQGTDPDMATVNVQTAISSAQGLLPAEVTTSGVTVKRRQSSNLKMITVYSPDNSFDDEFIVNYMKINVEPRIARVSGVGEVDVMGAEYALRIWLDPLKMAQYNLVPSDIETVLAQQNVEYPTGTLGYNSENAFQYELRYKGRLEDEIDFENIVLKSLSSGEVLFLKDVATVELGLKEYTIFSQTNGKNGRTCRISQTSGSNANDVIKGIDAVVDDIRADLPKGLVIEDIMSTKDFLDASIKNVLWTLIEAILLVILVIYIFLQNFRSSIIPSIAIVVSLIGTFALLYIFGFSINLLTLFALILVIGTVVDDAIVVVEAVQHKFDGGYKSAYLATVDAMGQITSALVTTTIVFMAVFIPVCFISGTTGTFYTQFGVTMAVAVAISTLNALTLSPALCALIMKPHRDVAAGEKANFSYRFHVAFESAFSSIVDKYIKHANFFLKHKFTAFIFVVIACVALFFYVQTTKTSLVPNEDTGVCYVMVQTPPGYSHEETSKIMDQVDACITQLEEVKIYTKVIGVNMMASQGSNNGMFILKLKDWSEREGKEHSVDAITARIYEQTGHISSAQIMVIAPPMVSGFSMSNGFEVHVQDRQGGSVEDLFKYTNDFIDQLAERPEIERVQTSFSTKFPQYLVDVDAATCERNGVSPSDVLSAISGYVGGSYASNFNKFSKLYRVILQAPIDARLDLQSLENIFVRNSSGDMSPITQYAVIERVYGAQTLYRYNLYSSISVNGTPADGYSSGQAIAAVQEVASQALPVGYGYEFGGLTLEESNSTGSTAIIFAICIIFVYLILCALYESIFIPMAVILSVPFGLVGSFMFANFFSLTNDIYMQTGLIMLIGLLAKTAILLTEYASERRRQGNTIMASAISAAKARLRPILMTSLTLIFGMLPLMFATGVGANGNISLGVTVVGGMIIGTISLIFIVPALFVIFQNIEERLIPKRIIPTSATAVVVVLLALPLSSCGLYSNYSSTTEEDNNIKELYNYIEATDDTTNIANISWREFFTDSHLQALISKGLENNSDLSVAQINVEQAEIALTKARLAYIPSVNASVSGGASSFNGSNSQTYEAALTASWEIDLFGKLRNAKRQSKAALEQSRAYRQAVQTQLIATIANSYYSLLMLDEQLKISEQTQVNWDENIRVMQAMKRAGRVNEAAVLQSQASSAALQSQIITLREQIAELENTLSTLLSMPTEHIERGVITDIQIPDNLSFGVPMQLLTNRPDVRMAESYLEQMFYATSEARGSLYPSITLSGTIGYTNSYGVTVNPAQMLYNAAAQVLQPIFNQGTLRAQLKISKLQQQQALIQFNQTVIEAGAEVNNALSSWQAAQARLYYTSEQVELLQRAVTNTELLMKHGSSTYLEVLTAQLTLLTAELSYASDIYNQAQGVVNLYRALGGGEE